MKLVKILAVLVFCLVHCCFVQAARGVNAESLDRLGGQCAGAVSSADEAESDAYDVEGQKRKCKHLGR